MMVHETVIAIVGLFVGSQFFWEFLKWAMDKMGEALTGRKKATLNEISDKLDTHQKDIDSLKQSLGDMRDDEAQKDAEAARRRILRFNDELLRSLDHSKEYFDDILEDVRIYEEFCHEHPKFPNGKTVMATDNIRRCYKSCMEKHNFLEFHHKDN